MIAKYMHIGNITIDPFNEAQMNPNSYDVCLGNWFVLVNWGNDGEPLFNKPMYVEDGMKIIIPNGGTLLGITKEFIGTVDCIVAEIRAKSSTRRIGITICDDAGFGDIGFCNRWVVEFTSHIQSGAARLTVGEPFAQMVFFLSEYLPNEYQYKGQYTSTDFPLAMIPKKYRDTRVAEYSGEELILVGD